MTSPHPPWPPSPAHPSLPPGRGGRTDNAGRMARAFPWHLWTRRRFLCGSALPPLPVGGREAGRGGPGGVRVGPGSLVLATLCFFSAPVIAETSTEKAPPPSSPKQASVRFEEIGEQAGVRIVHSTRDFGERYKAEVLEMFTEGGAAAAVGDFDGDGFDDLFVVDSGEGKRNRLMRNNGNLTFTDVTEQAGVGGGNDPKSICADALWLDYDNDGRLDLLVGRFGTPILYRNLGSDKKGGVASKGRQRNIAFEDVSVAAGLTKFGNTLAMIAFDHDNDGWLDLLFGNYFQPRNLLDLDTRQVLPNNLDYADNGGGVTFWRNVPLKEGGRGFVEITEEAGFSGHTGWSLDLGHADLNNDGLQDVYVAGDYGTDRLFLNQGPGANGTYRFKDVTEEAMGLDTRKGMNVDMGDYNRDGFLDVYVTNITDEYMKECNFLWHNEGVGEEGSLTLIDLSRETGTCDTDWGWAAKFGDFDNDGWEDIFAVNGLRSRGEQNYIPVLLEMIITPGVDFSDVDSYPDIGEMTWSGYQKQRFFHNLGDGTFKESGAEAGLDNDLDGRGIAMADFDNDGRLDLYQTNANQPALLHHNRTRGAGSWLELRLEGTDSNRDAIGARVTVTAAGESYLREVNGGNAYASQSTTRLHFGLGKAKAVDSLEIRWPSGRVEKLAAKGGKPPVAIDAISKIKEGKGVVR